MSRRLGTILIVGLATLLVAATAWAVFAPELPGRAHATTTVIAWDQSIAPTTSNDAGMNDPITAGMTPTRSAVNVSEGNASYSPPDPDMIISWTGTYVSDLVTVEGTFKTTGGVKIQSVSITDDSANNPGPNTVAFTPGVEFDARLEPAACGQALNGADHTVAFELRALAPRTSAASDYFMKVHVTLVANSQFVSGNCNPWS